MSDGSVRPNEEQEISQMLGEALYGYSEQGLPKWGDYVAVTLAIEAGRRIRQLTEALQKIARTLRSGAAISAAIHEIATTAHFPIPLIGAPAAR